MTEDPGISRPPDPLAAEPPHETFCILPWVHLATTVDGVWGRCCFDATNDYDHYYQQTDEPVFTLTPDALGCLPNSRYATANPERTFGLTEAFNSPVMRHAPGDVGGKRPSACRHCYQREDDKLPSHRQVSNTRFGDRVDLGGLLDATADDGELRATPFFLDCASATPATCPASCAASDQLLSRATIDARRLPQGNSSQLDRDRVQLCLVGIGVEHSGLCRQSKDCASSPHKIRLETNGPGVRRAWLPAPRSTPPLRCQGLRATVPM